MLKKMGLAAAITLVAVSAMATNFRVSDQVYVTAAIHGGSAGGLFLTDLFVSNLEAFPVTVSVIFASGTSGTVTPFNNLFTLNAGERREFVDFVGASAPNGLGNQNGFGQLIFNGCKQGASCTEAADPTGANFGKISVESRVYSIPPGASQTQVPAAPTTGQLLSGYPWYNYVSEEQSNNGLDKVFITGIRQTGTAGTAGTYRTNIGILNASQFSTTNIRVKLFNGTGTQIGSSFEQALGALGHTQLALTQMFPGAAFTNNMWVTVEQHDSGAISSDPNVVPLACQPPTSKGCPGFFAYGSVLDNASGDATTLEPQYFKALNDAQIACIYPSASQTTVCKGTPVMHRAVRH